MRLFIWLGVILGGWLMFYNLNGRWIYSMPAVLGFLVGWLWLLFAFYELGRLNERGESIFRRR